jgi:ribosome biogenesis GTPase
MMDAELDERGDYSTGCHNHIPELSGTGEHSGVLKLMFPLFCFCCLGAVWECLQVAAWGYSAVAVSCETGVGIEHLAQMLAGKVSVVAGPSGAGKSSLINALRLGRHKPDAPAAAAAVAGVQWQFQKQEQQAQAASSSSSGSENVSPTSSSSHDGSETYSSSGSSSGGSASTSYSSSGSSNGSSGSFLAVGDVSRIGRGRHTTRTVTLIELPFGGLMADTPGFNQPTLDRVSSSELAGLFPEFVAAQEASGGCRCARGCVKGWGGWATRWCSWQLHGHEAWQLAGHNLTNTAK